MRVLFVSHYALPHLGGVEMVIDAVARRLIARGHDVTHLASAATREGEGTIIDQPYEVVRVPAWNGLERRGFPFPVPGPRVTREVRRRLSDADVIHVHGMLFLPSALALRAARRVQHPCRILTEHSGPVGDPPSAVERVETFANFTLGSWTARAAHAIVLINPAIEPLMRRLAPSSETVAIPNGVDTDRFRPATPDEKKRLRTELGWDDTPRVLYVGRVMKRKGVHLAVQAASMAAPGEVELVVAGSGNVESHTRNVRLLGAVPPEHVPDLYRAADAFVLPSVREGFPVTVQEAMASGLPVVVSDTTVAERLVAAGDTSAIYARPQPAEILAAIRTALAERAARGPSAAAFARRVFAWDGVIDAHLELYERVIERNRRRS